MTLIREIEFSTTPYTAKGQILLPLTLISMIWSSYEGNNHINAAQFFISENRRLISKFAQKYTGIKLQWLAKRQIVIVEPTCVDLIERDLKLLNMRI